MKFTEAFRALGYEVESPRQDWSAENATGICISLWRKELSRGGQRMNSREGSGSPELWVGKPGNRKRIRHLERAATEFDGYVDVVIVHGVPGESYGDADPWIPNERRGARWRVEDFDPSTGHFTAVLIVAAS